MTSRRRVLALLLSIPVAACRGGVARPTTQATGTQAAATHLTKADREPPENEMQRDLRRFGDLLLELRVTELSLGPGSACEPVDVEEAWLISGAAEADGGASCLIGERGATCVAASDPDLDRAALRICGGTEPRIAAPPWVERIALLVRSRRDLLYEVSRVAAPAALPAMRVSTDSFGHHLMVKVSGRWWPAPESLAEGRRPGILRVLDASALGSDAIFLAVAESYDGGSEMGGGETWLHLFCGSAHGPVECGRKQIGLFRWALAAEDRDKYPQGAHSLRARPHIEAELEPSVTRGGLLELSLAYSMLPADRSEWEPEESCAEDEGEGEACDPVSAIEKLVNDAGLWRLADGRLVLARP
jgi:hypothetical protein